MSKTISYAKASLKINGVKVAFIGGVEINEQHMLTEVPVLDQIELAEHAETGHRVSFTCSYFKTDTTNVQSLGLSPANLDDVLTQPELTMEIYNRTDDRVEYTVSGVKWAGGTGSISANDIWRGQWQFVGRKGTGL